MKKALEKVSRRFIKFFQRRIDLRDGSYHPNRKFDVINTPKSDQNSIPNLVIDDQIGVFRIEFGDDRSFSNGHVEVLYKDVCYSSLSDSSKSLLLLKTDVRENTSALGESKNHVQTWQIPESEITFQTVIMEFVQSQFIQFEVGFPQEIDGLQTGLTHNPSIRFPIFTNATPNERMLTFNDKDFADPLSAMKEFAASPVCLFDDQKNSVLFSALNDFTTNIIVGTKPKTNPPNSYYNAVFEMGLSGKVDSVPKDYKIHFIMVFENGINKIFDLWGDLLHKYYDVKERSIDPYENLMNSHLGYFTDNGAYYYYNPIPEKTYDETLIEVEKYYTQIEPLPFTYYHFDSWWYPKSVGQTGKGGGGRAGGCLLWEPHKDAWGMEFDTLHEKLGNKPFTAHARWYDATSPYVEKYPFIVENNWAMPDSLEFWQMLMEYAKNNHIFIFEQDWMVNIYRHFTHLRSVIGANAKWLEHMSLAAAEQDIDIQYCMATPSQWMESIKFPNVVNLRTARDYHSYMHIEQWMYQFTQNALLVRAIGKIPFLDVFFASYKQSDYFYQEHWPEVKALLNVLGTGPIAPGDKIGEIDRDLIFRMCRKDGLILKPDRPLTAVDLMFIEHKTHYVASTESNHGDLSWHYILNFNIRPREVSDPNYKLEDIGVTGSFIEFDWFAHELKKVDTNTMLEFDWKKKEYEYCIYAPILPNGIAIIGDITKYASASKAQFQNLKWSDNGIEFDIAHAKGDEVKLWIWMSNKPDEDKLQDFDCNWISEKNILEFNLKFEQTGLTHLKLDF